MSEEVVTTYTLSASLDTFEKVNEYVNMDPFVKGWDEIRGYRGPSTNFKRNTTRAINKAAQIPKGPDGIPIAAYGEAAKTQARGVGGAGSKQINPGEVYRNGYGLFDVITPPYNLYELAGFYDTNYANHAAIDAKVENIVGQGYKFNTAKDVLLKLEESTNKAAGDKAKKRINRLKAELEVWLESLNEEDGFINMMEKVYTDVQAIGNGYIEVSRTIRGDIGYIGHIPASTMRVRRHRDGFVQIVGGKVIYFRNFGAKNANPVTDDPRPNEIIHIKEYSPLNTFYGVPDIVSALGALVGDQMASQYNIDYFENKAVPRYIILVKGAKLDSESEERLFRFFQTSLKGNHHRTLYIPLPVDSEGNKIEFEMHAVENTAQEASFGEFRKQNRDEILLAHQIPLSKLGGTDAASISGALSQDRTFKEQVSRPAQRHLQKILSKIISEKTDIVTLAFEELTLTDEDAEAQILERYIRNQIMVPNEARERIGLPSRDGGEKPFEPTPRQAADAKNNAAQSDSRATDRTNNASDSANTNTGRNAKGSGRAAS